MLNFKEDMELATTTCKRTWMLTVFFVSHGPLQLALYCEHFAPPVPRVFPRNPQGSAEFTSQGGLEGLDSYVRADLPDLVQ
jgi:hypothetical protein